ncbi:MAG: cytochrome c-type biogenesis protein [Deinococcales bacterium]
MKILFKICFCSLLFLAHLGLAQEILEQRVFEIARQLRCPVCRAESAADSSAETSQEFRQIIQEQLEAGKSEAEILAFFRERYGDWILLSPPKEGLHLLVWLLPIIAGLIALIVLAMLMQRWLRKSREHVVVSDQDRLEVGRALEHFNNQKEQN